MGGVFLSDLSLLSHRTMLLWFFPLQHTVLCILNWMTNVQICWKASQNWVFKNCFWFIREVKNWRCIKIKTDGNQEKGSRHCYFMPLGKSNQSNKQMKQMMKSIFQSTMKPKSKMTRAQYFLKWELSSMPKRKIKDHMTSENTYYLRSNIKQKFKTVKFWGAVIGTGEGKY